jgi:hypothetical protein
LWLGFSGAVGEGTGECANSHAVIEARGHSFLSNSRTLFGFDLGMTSSSRRERPSLTNTPTCLACARASTAPSLHSHTSYTFASHVDECEQWMACCAVLRHSCVDTAPLSAGNACTPPLTFGVPSPAPCSTPPSPTPPTHILTSSSRTSALVQEPRPGKQPAHHGALSQGCEGFVQARRDNHRVSHTNTHGMALGLTGWPSSMHL